jgi:hypothetical protein
MPEAVLDDAEDQHDDPGRDQRFAEAALQGSAPGDYFLLAQLPEELGDCKAEADERQRGPDDRASMCGRQTCACAETTFRCDARKARC